MLYMIHVQQKCVFKKDVIKIVLKKFTIKKLYVVYDFFSAVIFLFLSIKYCNIVAYFLAIYE